MKAVLELKSHTDLDLDPDFNDADLKIQGSNSKLIIDISHLYLIYYLVKPNSPEPESKLSKGFQRELNWEGVSTSHLKPHK